MLEKRIEQDLKVALLSGDRLKVDTLRGIKSALLYAKVEQGKRESGLSPSEEISVLSKESKKRQESADLYAQGGSAERAKAELAEKSIIDKYLPKQLSEEEIATLIDESIAKLGMADASGMGQVIADVKARSAGAADGGRIAKLVKDKLK